jgi:hypothetical protein
MSSAVHEGEHLPTRAEAVATLERVLGWLATLEDGQGRLMCPEHRIEHTGKSACAALLALELFRATGRRAHLDFAVRQGRRLVARLEREGDSPCHTFRPGRHDPFNCSNSVIDGGACADALATLCLLVPGDLGADDRRAFQDAAVLHTDTYLKYACRDKGIPAQRAWALTGLASTYALAPDPQWLAAAREAFELIAGVQRADGSHPYHPLEWGAGHPGSADASSFYQSRVPGFQMFAAERLGLELCASTLGRDCERALAFVAGLQGPDGVKVGLVEAKPWYWGAPTEVASHVFDVHALARGAAHFAEPAWRDAARRAFAAWAARLEPSGRPTSHAPGPGRGASYQCALFWASHACWAARALADFPDSPLPEVEPDTRPRLTWFASTELARFDTPTNVVFVRGARPPGSALHGSPVGNGVVRVVRRDGAEVLTRCRLAGHEAGEWNGRAGGFDLARGWRSGADDVRFSFWLARVAWRRGERARALGLPLAHLSRDVLAFAHARVSSAFCRTPRAEVGEGELQLFGSLAWRDGTVVPGSRVERRYRVDASGLHVAERLVAAGAARGLAYAPPAVARDVQRDGDGWSYRLA